MHFETLYHVLVARQRRLVCAPIHFAHMTRWRMTRARGVLCAGAAHTCNDMGIRNAAEKTDAQLKTAGLFESETRIRKYITALRDPETVNMPHASFNFDMKRGGKNGARPHTLTAGHARRLS